MPVPHSPALDRSLLRDEVFERLRDAIVDGTLAPGEQLRDGDLATWLGVSRTPIREALQRLAHAGLVMASPGRSTIVTSLDARTVRDAQAVVASMHDIAVRTAVPLLTTSDLQTMREANQEFTRALNSGDVDAALRADDAFHDVPVQVAGNAAVAAVLEQFTPVVRRLERLRFSTLAGRESIALHASLVGHCSTGEVEEAVAVSHATWSTLSHLLDIATPEMTSPDMTTPEITSPAMTATETR